MILCPFPFGANDAGMDVNTSQLYTKLKNTSQPEVGCSNYGLQAIPCDKKSQKPSCNPLVGGRSSGDARCTYIWISFSRTSCQGGG
jgi:hypothetical protein